MSIKEEWESSYIRERERARKCRSSKIRRRSEEREREDSNPPPCVDNLKAYLERQTDR